MQKSLVFGAHYKSIRGSLQKSLVFGAHFESIWGSSISLGGYVGFELNGLGFLNRMDWNINQLNNESNGMNLNRMDGKFESNGKLL